MSALLEPGDLGLDRCARCDHELRPGEPYHRGMTRSPAGMSLYILCGPCAQHLLRDAAAAEKFADGMLSTLQTATLAGMPTGGSA